MPTLDVTTLEVKAQVSHRFNARAETVFDAWITPSKIRQWFGPGLGEVTRALVDPREGGLFSVVQRRGMNDVEHNGHYQAFVRPQRLVFTWQVKGTEHASKVSIDITPTDSGCDLSLTHALHPLWADYKGKVEDSWSKMLAAMAEAVAK